MTRISTLGGVAAARNGGTAPRGTATSFAPAVSRPSATATITPVGLGALLALQDEAAAPRRDRAARRGGESVLGALARLQAAMLDDGGDLSGLREAISRMTEPADPALAAIIAAIRLRARVELARRDRV
ncbi:MAG: flagellar assembly protein FliX [Acidiphilium sp.]